MQVKNLCNLLVKYVMLNCIQGVLYFQRCKRFPFSLSYFSIIMLSKRIGCRKAPSKHSGVLFKNQHKTHLWFSLSLQYCINSSCYICLVNPCWITESEYLFTFADICSDRSCINLLPSTAGTPTAMWFLDSVHLYRFHHGPVISSLLLPKPYLNSRTY